MFINSHLESFTNSHVWDRTSAPTHCSTATKCHAPNCPSPVPGFNHPNSKQFDYKLWIPKICLIYSLNPLSWKKDVEVSRGFQYCWCAIIMCVKLTYMLERYIIFSTTYQLSITSYISSVTKYTVFVENRSMWVFAVLSIFVDNEFSIPVYLLCVPSYKASAVLTLAKLPCIFSVEDISTRSHVSPAYRMCAYFN